MFKVVLSKLMGRVSGARWALIAGVDGVIVEVNGIEAKAAEALAAEYGTFFRDGRRVVQDTGHGTLQGSVIFTDCAKIVFQFITHDYFLLLGLNLTAVSGKARYEISRSRTELEKELVS